MTVTLLRGRKDRMYGVIAGGDDYYAFWEDGRAGLYVDGTFISYRATGGPTIPEAPCLIHEDSEAIVGVGAIAYRVDATHLKVWDVEGEATYDYAVPAGYVCSPPVYADGFVWWVERETVQHGGAGAHATDFRLVKSRTDLSTDLAIVYTYTAAHYLGFSASWGNNVLGIAITTTLVLVQDHWVDDVANEVNDTFQIAIQRSGGGATDNGWPAIAPPPAVDVDAWVFNIAPATAAGLGAGAVGEGLLAGVAADSDVSPVAFWSGVEWQVGSCTNTSVSADGSEGSVYGSGSLVRGPAEAGTPTKLFAAGPSPADDTPYYMYIKG